MLLLKLSHGLPISCCSSQMFTAEPREGHLVLYSGVYLEGLRAVQDKGGAQVALELPLHGHHCVHFMHFLVLSDAKIVRSPEVNRQQFVTVKDPAAHAPQALVLAAIGPLLQVTAK